MPLASSATTLAEALAALGDQDSPHVQVRTRGERTYLVIRNEFATVWLEIDLRSNGVRVVLTDAETEASIALDPLELEAVCRMAHADFDEMILERGSKRAD
jgi:hypothetical protein